MYNSYSCSVVVPIGFSSGSTDRGCLPQYDIIIYLYIYIIQYTKYDIVVITVILTSRESCQIFDNDFRIFFIQFGYFFILFVFFRLVNFVYQITFGLFITRVGRLGTYSTKQIIKLQEGAFFSNDFFGFYLFSIKY